MTENNNPLGLDNKQEEVLKRLASDEAYFIENCLSVIDKQTNTQTRFILNGVQRHYLKNKSRFDIILKSRKGGISTYIIASDIWACTFKKNQKAILLTQSDEDTKKMFAERVIPILKSSIFPLNVQIKADSLYWPDTNSTYYIGTAGSRKFGRGSDITRFHLSEFAHWPNDDVLTGIEEALLEDAIGRIETTANGINFFHNMWKRAQSGGSRYGAVFIPWFLDNTYKIDKGQIDVLTEQETGLCKAFDLSPEQLMWRRSKIKDMSRPELFPQEYPATPEEAFLSNNKMVFDWVSLVNHEKACKEPKWKGLLRDMGESIEFMPTANGCLSIWQIPIEGHRYVIGADIAEGLEGGCYSTAFVYDVNESEQVAEWCGHIPPDKFGETLYLLGLYYNSALMVPEAWPGVGAVTCAKLVEMRYTNLFKRERTVHSRRTDEQLLGWETTSRTKPLMIHSLAGEGIREYGMTIRSRFLIDEMKSLVYNNDSIEPQKGCFSDRVIACAIAWYVSRQLSQIHHSEKKTLREIFFSANRTGALSIPNYSGPRYGVRRK